MFRPVDALGLLGPKAVGIGQRACVHFLVFGLGDEGAPGPLGGNFVDLIRHAVLHSVRDRARILSVWRPLSTRLPQRTSLVARVSEAIPGAELTAIQPGCRFAHPGYIQRCALNSWSGNADASGV